MYLKELQKEVQKIKERNKILQFERVKRVENYKNFSIQLPPVVSLEV